jgi:hypothetical protein
LIEAIYVDNPLLGKGICNGQVSCPVGGGYDISYDSSSSQYCCCHCEDPNNQCRCADDTEYPCCPPDSSTTTTTTTTPRPSSSSSRSSSSTNVKTTYYYADFSPSSNHFSVDVYGTTLSEFDRIQDNGWDHNLTGVKIGDGVKVIGPNAFGGNQCQHLKYIKFPDSVEIIKGGQNRGALDGSQATGISFGTGIKTIEDYAFNNCFYIKNSSLDLPNIEYIGKWAFTNWAGSGALNIGKPFRVYDYAFMGASIQELNFTPASSPADNNGFIGYHSFMSCRKLKNIDIPSGYTEIGYGAFWDCISATGLHLRSGIKLINAGFGFAGCASLININLENGIEYIHDYMFAGCINLKNINIPDSVTGIGVGAFNACVSLTGIKLPNSNQFNTISNRAFSNCTDLNYIIIPSNITKINSGAFVNCPNLERFYFYGNAPILENYALGTNPYGIVLYCTSSVSFPDVFGDKTTYAFNCPLDVNYPPNINIINRNFDNIDIGTSYYDGVTLKSNNYISGWGKSFNEYEWFAAQNCTCRNDGTKYVEKFSENSNGQIKQLDIGFTSLLLLTNNSVTGFGYNNIEQLKIPSITNQNTKKVKVLDNTYYAILNNNQITVWPTEGKICVPAQGTCGTGRPALNPFSNSFNKNVVDIDGSSFGGLVLFEDGTVTGWGTWNSFPTPSGLSVSELNSIQGNVTGISCWQSYFGVLLKNGHAKTWFINDEPWALYKDINLLTQEELDTFKNIPNEIQGQIKQLELCRFRGYAVLNDSTAVCWSATGIDSSNPIHGLNRIPQAIQGKISKIKASDYNVMVLLNNGTVNQWGNYGREDYIPFGINPPAPSMVG